MKTCKRLPLIATSLWILTFSFPALAALGGDVTSVATDSAQMKASVKITSTSGYTVHEIKSTTRTVVREYVSPEGRVFGVAWQGPFMPNLQQILGTYFQQFSVAVQEAKRTEDSKKQSFGRRPLSIREPGLVVENAGHMRAFAGRAYDPGLLPEGVSPETVR
jgi:Protein of unknown function (DUF2844)